MGDEFKDLARHGDELMTIKVYWNEPTTVTVD